MLPNSKNYEVKLSLHRPESHLGRSVPLSPVGKLKGVLVLTCRFDSDLGTVALDLEMLSNVLEETILDF